MGHKIGKATEATFHSFSLDFTLGHRANITDLNMTKSQRRNQAVAKAGNAWSNACSRNRIACGGSAPPA